MKKIFCLFLLLFLFCIETVFCGPFGIEFRMSLDQIKKISKTSPESIGNDWYLITPPNTHELFEYYAVQIHPTYGVYFIKAISKNISTNGHGTELISRFNGLLSSIERTYGKYLKRDRLKRDGIFTESQYFMYTLTRGDRELIAF